MAFAVALGAFAGAAPAGAGAPNLATVRVTHGLAVIDVRADGQSNLIASLNGRDESASFDAPRGGRRTLVASLADGLRPGSNVLRVRILGARGAAASITRRFTVTGPMLSAGTTNPAVVGQPTQLLATVRGWPGRPRFSWRLVAQPGPGAAQVRADGSRVTLLPRRLGSYVLQARAIVGRVPYIDSVRIDASPPEPLVPLRTLVGQGGGIGTQVGEKFYRAGSGGLSGGMQVVVLSRRTLEEERNVTAACDGPSNCNTSLQQALKDVGDRSMVVVSFLPGSAFELDPGNVSALASIGLDPHVAPLRSGAFTLVGVPGMKPGQAAERAPSRHARFDPPAGLDTNLVKDENNLYTPLGLQQVSYNTRAPGGTATSNTIVVGSKRYTQSSATGGLQILALDAYSLKPVVNTVVDLRSKDLASVLPAALASPSGQALLFVASIGAAVPASRRLFGVPWAQAGDELAEFGGTQLHFNDLAPGSSYTLVGSSRLSQGGGDEVDAPQGKPGARAIGSLSLDYNTQSWQPAAAESGELSTLLGERGNDPGARLLQIALQPAVSWPHQDTAPRRAALICIGKAVGIGGNVGFNPRLAYWNSGLNVDWNDVAVRIHGLAFADAQKPDLCAGSFGEEDFALLKADLIQEARWVATVRGYTDRLIRIFSTSQISAQAQILKLVTEVRDQIGIQADAQVTTSVLRLIGRVGAVAASALKFVPGIGQVADGVALVTNAYNVVFDVTTTNWVGARRTSDLFEATVAKLGSELGDRLTAGEGSINRLIDIVVSDRGRLQSLGTLMSDACSPPAPCFPRLTTDLQNDTAKTFKLGARATVLTTLLPRYFTLWQIDPAGDHVWPLNALKCSYRFLFRQPFEALPPGGQLQAAVSSTAHGPFTRNWGLLRSANWHTPPASIDRLFEPVDLRKVPLIGDDTSGMGLDKRRFYVSNFEPQIFINSEMECADREWPG